MSRRRPGTCREPGPYDYHCSLDPLHDWSCYDDGEDSSWNDRSPEDWQTETPHDCPDPFCPDNPTQLAQDPALTRRAGNDEPNPDPRPPHDGRGMSEEQR